MSKLLKMMAIATTLLVASLHAESQTPKTLKASISLKIDRPGGANGASVAWHPVQKKYYAAQAGNETFPMEVFDEKGKMLSDDKLETMFDVRGFWYNPNTKTLQANGYDNNGWAEYKLNGKGIPTAVTKMDKEAGKPDAQSVGIYDPKNNVVYYLDFNSSSLERHVMKDGVSDTSIALHLGAKSKDEIKDPIPDDIKGNYNENAIIYTGIAKSEIGVLNFNDKQIELYNIGTGLRTQILKLPSDAPVQASLNFSYSNGTYWLYDKTERIWHGYK